MLNGNLLGHAYLHHDSIMLITRPRTAFPENIALCLCKINKWVNLIFVYIFPPENKQLTVFYMKRFVI